MLAPRVLWIVPPDGDVLEESRFSAVRASSLCEGLEALHTEQFDVVLAGVAPADDPVALLAELQQAQPGTPIVLHHPGARNSEAARLVHLGAFYVLRHGDAISLLHLAANLKCAHAQESGQSQREPWREQLVGDSRPMQLLVETIRLIAPRRATVLITGETGTGKEVVARSIHAASDRAGMPMVCVNCSALPETLLEAELFGHVRGAFTGAVQARAGRFEQAQRGTIFLDEIGDLPLPLQSKLLRVLQEREFQRLGSSETVRVDVRVIAATHADLPQMIRQGRFREDLFYRLNVISLRVPALRDRPCDVGPLIAHFVQKVCRAEHLPSKRISPQTVEWLAGHDWPGNVRELENAVEKAVVLSDKRVSLVPGDFPLPPRRRAAAMRGGELLAVPDQGLDFEATVGSLERNLLEQALQKSGGNKKRAASMLGLKRTTLSAKLRSLAAAG